MVGSLESWGGPSPLRALEEGGHWSLVKMQVLKAGPGERLLDCCLLENEIVLTMEPLPRFYVPAYREAQAGRTEAVRP